MTHWERMRNLYSPIPKFILHNKIGKYMYFFKQKFPLLRSWQSGVWKGCDVACSKGASVVSSQLAAILQTYCLPADPHPSPGFTSMTLCCL